MADFNNTIRINNENQEGLQTLRQNEVKRIQKLKFIISLLKNANVREFDVQDHDAIEEALSRLSVQNYLKLDDENTLLDLSECKTITLSYTERKAFRNYLVKKIPEVCNPIVEYAEKIKKEIPKASDCQATTKHKLLELEEKRRELELKLIETKNKKCHLLKMCADIKMGPYIKNELDIMFAECRLNHVKANTLQGLLVNNFLSRTKHSMKAIKEVQAYIKSELDQETE